MSMLVLSSFFALIGSGKQGLWATMSIQRCIGQKECDR